MRLIMHSIFTHAMAIRRCFILGLVSLSIAGVPWRGAAAFATPCTLLNLPLGCTPATPPPPDPGGADHPDQPIPYAEKPFGFNLGYQPYGDSTPDRSLEAMAATGATIERDAVPWIGMTGTNASQPVSSEFLNTPMGGARVGSSLRFWDQRYLDLLARGIKPITIVGFVPIWASTLYQCLDDTYRLLHISQCPDGWWTGHLLPHPSFYPQWRAYVAAVARRYPQAIIEGPNEPDLQWTNHQANLTHSAYPEAVDANTAAAIQCQLYSAVRSVDDRTVLSSGLFTPAYEQAYIQAAHSCYDAFSFHIYTGKPPGFAGMAQAFADLRSARAAGGDNSPIWITETGYSSKDDLATYADGARALYNRFVTMPDVGAVLFHTLRNAPLQETSSPSSYQYWFGFFYVDWTPKPVACRFVAGHGETWPGC